MPLDIPTSGYSPHLQPSMYWSLGAHVAAGLKTMLHALKAIQTVHAAMTTAESV